MSWLIVAIFAYFLFAIVALVDKYLLGRLIPSPKIYAFYVGALGILALLFVPFGFLVPDTLKILLAILAGVFHILAIFAYFTGLKNFETSRIVPAIGGFAPLFTFGLTYIFTGGKPPFSIIETIAFLLLILGSILITRERSKNISLKSLQISALTAFLFATYFVLAKFVYLEQPFISGFIWTRIGAFLMAIVLLVSKEVREELFMKRKTFELKVWGILLPNQTMAAGAFILQNWAIALAGIAYVAIISALGGIQYVFVLIFVIILSLTQPFWAKRAGLKEEISRQILFQKIFAISLIGSGIILLALK